MEQIYTLFCTTIHYIGALLGTNCMYIPTDLDDGLQLLQFYLQHLVLSLQLVDLLPLGPVLDVVLQFETLPPLQLAFLLHLVQPVLQLVDLRVTKRRAEMLGRWFRWSLTIRSLRS